MKKEVQIKVSKVIAGKRQQLFDRQLDMKSDVLYVNLGAQCNEDCSFCLIKGNEHNFPAISLNEAKRVIRNFAKSGGSTIILTGGEPTLRDDLPEIVAFTESLEGITKVSIITNGVRLGEEEFFSKLIAADVRHKLHFCFSIHSHLKEVLEKITQSENTFKKSWQGLSAAIKAGMAVSVYHVVVRDNFQYLPDFGKFLRDNFPAVRSVIIAYPFPQGSALKNTWIYVPFSELKPFLTQALRFFEDNKYNVDVAACGQFPLCVISGFEEKVVKSLAWSEEMIVGVVGQDVFHEFEWGSESCVSHYKNKKDECQSCIMNRYCQGFWKEYIALFGFDGLEPVNFERFQGSKIKTSLVNQSGFQRVVKALSPNKFNVIKLSSFNDVYLESLKKFLLEKRILAVILKP